MADVYWDRIEPHTRDVGLEEGLQMRVADPLWMLARQWQVGEFRGEDAASPIHVHLTVEHGELATFRNDARAGASVEPFPSGRPLESRVEAEAVRPATIGFAAEAGLGLLRRLDHAELGHLRAKLRARYGLRLRPADMDGLPEREVRRLRLLVRGSLDGDRLLATDPQALLQIAPERDRESFAAVLDAWRRERLADVDRPGPSGETWVADRLEHSFSIAAATKAGEVLLSAAEYPGGHLDWHAFDLGGAPPHKPRAKATRERTLNRLPVPLAYAGMPRSRLWELEEGSVYFGGIEAGPADIGRIVVAEYATVYSDDWFLLPVRFPSASVARVKRAVVHNTFGERHQVRSVAEADESDPSTGERTWAFCELSGDDSAANGATPWLLLLPTLAGAQNGSPLEAVSFVRDEAANLVWAIEERIETATGGSIRRRLLAARAGADRIPPSSSGEAGPEGTTDAQSEDPPWRYRLQSAVPPYWVPLVAERVEPDSAQVRLRRARMLAWEELDDPGIAGPKGRLLAPTRAMTLHEEEVPHAGAEVTRRWQLARGPDGHLHAWLARRKRPGRGERGSGLRYDAIDSSSAGPDRALRDR